MSRPKQCDYEASAKGKIESAFWRVLEKEGFDAITIQRLSQETGLHRNSVYYHFPNMQQLSLFAFNHIFSYDASRVFVNALLSGQELDASVLEDAELLPNVKKIHLFAKSDSPLLTHILKDSLKKAWFTHLGISEEALSPTDIMELEYILSGFIGIIGSEELLRQFPVLRSFPNTAMGRAAMETLKEIAACQSRKVSLTGEG